MSSKSTIEDDIRFYLDDNTNANPYFIAFDSPDQLKAIRKSFFNFQVIRLSDFCNIPDSTPDKDKVVQEIISCPNKQILLVGLGELSALTDDYSFCNRLFELQLPPGKKVLIPLWNGYKYLDEKRKSDIRLDSSRMAEFDSQRHFWKLLRLPNTVKNPSPTNSFQAILKALEDGSSNSICVKTQVPINEAWCRQFSSEFDWFCYKYPKKSRFVTKGLFNAQEWADFCDEGHTKNEDIFSADQLLEWKCNPPDNPYLSFVIKKTDSYSSYQRNLLCALLDKDTGDPDFKICYQEWKQLVKKHHFDISTYISESRIHDANERISYLSDNSPEEKNEIMVCIKDNQAVPDNLKDIYPDLADYLSPFLVNLSDTEFADLFNQHMNAYKDQKIYNRIADDFRQQVYKIAKDRPYFKLPSRGSILEKYDDNNTYLYWLDALGCEYLGFIRKKAQENGLQLTVKTARASLPTLTSINKEFYDLWKGPKKQNKELDKVKHGDVTSYGEAPREAATHLPKELEIISDVISYLAFQLKNGTYNKIVLTSDHGATRLAVIGKEEIPCKMAEKGKHGGRCCKVSELDGELPEFVTQDDQKQWNVMADYHRFKGGRSADVEVHGGATLEEIAVPVILFERINSKISITLTKDKYKVSFKSKSITLELFSTSILCGDIFVEFENRRYQAKRQEKNHQKYDVCIPDIKAGKYAATVLNGDNVICSIEFTVENAGVGIKKDNDFF